MEHHAHQTLEVPTKIHPAIHLLLEAYQYAEQTEADCWEFAVELNYLAALGLNHNDYRWLIRGGLVEHRREVTLEGDDGRAFRSTGDLTLVDRSCFILTEKGVSVAYDLCQNVESSNIDFFSSTTIVSDNGNKTEDCCKSSSNAEFRKSEQIMPKWDAERRMLCIHGAIVKQFKWTAMNQEAILAAFEEEGWPARIYDPLPLKPEQDPKRRLSDTIKCLNRKQKSRLIHFRGDGTGEAILWEYVGRNGTSLGTAG